MKSSLLITSRRVWGKRLDKKGRDEGKRVIKKKRGKGRNKKKTSVRVLNGEYYLKFVPCV